MWVPASLKLDSYEPLLRATRGVEGAVPLLRATQGVEGAVPLQDVVVLVFARMQQEFQRFSW